MWILTYLLIFHIVGDWLFQSERMLTQKWYNNILLAKHIIIYSTVLSVSLYFYPMAKLDIFKIIDYTFLVTTYHILSDLISSWEIQQAKIEGKRDRIILLSLLDQSAHLSVLFYFSHLLQ